VKDLYQYFKRKSEAKKAEAIKQIQNQAGTAATIPKAPERER